MVRLCYAIPYYLVIVWVFLVALRVSLPIDRRMYMPRHSTNIHAR